MAADDSGSEAATAHLLALVGRWAHSQDSVTGVRTAPGPLEGVRCWLKVKNGPALRFDFLFTGGVESGDADDAILDEISAAWAQDWIDDCEIFISGMLDEWSILARRGPEPPPRGALGPA